MQTIWKYELEITDVQTIKMPLGAQILTVQIQKNEIPVLWAVVFPDMKQEERTIVIVGTGNPIKESMSFMQHNRYIGTFQMEHIGFVGHVFEKLK